MDFFCYSGFFIKCIEDRVNNDCWPDFIGGTFCFINNK